MMLSVVEEPQNRDLLTVLIAFLCSSKSKLPVTHAVFIFCVFLRYNTYLSLNDKFESSQARKDAMDWSLFCSESFFPLSQPLV
jgi:hypothetical protein